MNKIKLYTPTVARTLLGLIFFLSGIVGFFNLVQPPPDLPQALIDFSGALMATGYFFQFVKLTEIVFGFLLIVKVAPALALVVLAPVTINIFLVHAFLTPGIENLILPILMIVFHVLAATKYWHLYRPLFNRN